MTGSNEAGPVKTMSVPARGQDCISTLAKTLLRGGAACDLPVIKIGNRYRVSVIALERMLAEASSNKRRMSVAGVVTENRSRPALAIYRHGSPSRRDISKLP